MTTADTAIEHACRLSRVQKLKKAVTARNAIIGGMATKRWLSTATGSARCRIEWSSTRSSVPDHQPRWVADLVVSDESLEVGFLTPEQIEGMPMHESIRLCIRHSLEHQPQPVIA